MAKPPSAAELAYHEAGHAVVSAVLGFVPDYVTIVANGTAAGSSGHVGGYRVVHGPGVLDQMTVSYAGYAAQVRFAPDAEERARNGAREDFAIAERCMRVLDMSSAERDALVEHKRAEAARLVDLHWAEIQRVADALISERTIDSDRLQQLLAACRPVNGSG